VPQELQNAINHLSGAMRDRRREYIAVKRTMPYECGSERVEVAQGEASMKAYRPSCVPGYASLRDRFDCFPQ
jgi:hypothetical protein